MTNSMFAIPAPRRLAMIASRMLERWATRPRRDETNPRRDEQARREAQAYAQALEAQERFALDALSATLLR